MADESQLMRALTKPMPTLGAYRINRKEVDKQRKEAAFLIALLIDHNDELTRELEGLIGNTNLGKVRMLKENATAVIAACRAERAMRNVQS